MRREERRLLFFSPPLSTVHRNSCLRFGAGLAASSNGCSCAQVRRAELIYSICRDGLHVPGMQPVVTHGFISSWVLLGSSKHTFPWRKRNVFPGSGSNYLWVSVWDHIPQTVSGISGQGKSSRCKDRYQWCNTGHHYPRPCFKPNTRHLVLENHHWCNTALILQDTKHLWSFSALPSSRQGC